MDSIYKYLKNINPYVIKDLKDCKGKKIVDYTKRIWKSDFSTENAYVKNGKKHLCNCLLEEVMRQYGSEAAIIAVKEFENMPVFQTGPHFQLAIERNNFYTALFSIIGLLENNMNFYFHSTCTTPTLETRHFYGPAWLNVYDTNFDIFDLSEKYKKKYSVLCSKGCFSFKFSPLYGSINPECVIDTECKLKDMLSDRTYSSLVNAFEEANIIIWDKLFHSRIKPVYLKEDFYSKLLLKHLRDKTSIVHRVFSDKDRQEGILTTVANETKLPWGSMIPNQTDFLWLRAEKKVKPISFSNTFIKSVNDKEGFCISNTVDEIIDAVEKGTLIPNIFTIILMESFSGGARLAGGLHQFAYFETFKKAFCNILDKNNLEERDLLTFIQSSNLNHWGSHVLEPDIDVFEFLNQNDFCIEDLADFFSEMSFDEAINDLYQFRSYFRWGELLCH